MLSSPAALLHFRIFVDTSTFDGSMDGGSMVEVIVGSSCEYWSAVALFDLYRCL